MAATDPFAQTRTARGAVACATVDPVRGGRVVAPREMEALRFRTLAPTELAARAEGAAPAGEGAAALSVRSRASRGSAAGGERCYRAPVTAPPAPAGDPDAASASAAHRSIPLLDLAACIALVPQTLPDGTEFLATGVDTAAMAAAARRYGPLIARAPFAHPAVPSAADSGTGEEAGPDGASERPRPIAPPRPAELVPGGLLEEPIGIWASAVLTANLAVTLQEFVAGSLSPAVMESKVPSLVKRRVENPETGTAFTLIMVSLALSSTYAAWLGAPAFVRREREGDRIDYSFLLDGDDETPFSVAVASFAREITASDYRLLSASCGLSAAVDADVRERLELGDAPDPGDPGVGQSPAPDPAAGPFPASAADSERSAYRLAADDLLGADEPVGENDLPLVRTLVRTLIAAHMRDARVDLFAADEETGYLAFGSALSWMWYGFSGELGIAKIQYCTRCGRAFPLVGHRGPEKLFCSAACKDAARNERTGRRRDAVRELFREQGTGVDELAERYFHEEGRREGARRVRAYLSSWPALKHDIDDDIAAHGWASPLLKRCRDEGLDLDKLLPARRKAELRKLSGKA